MIDREEKFQREKLQDFLKRLFPKLESIWGNTNYDYTWLDDWRKKCRICSPDSFDTFFRLSIPKGEISQKEIETILAMGNDPVLFREALLKLNQDGRIIRFLERLEDYTKDIPDDFIEPIITVLMDIGDSFPEGDSGFLGIDTPMRILRLFYQLTHRLQSHEKRFKIFKHSMEKAMNSLHTLVHEISVQDQQHGKNDSQVTSEPEEKVTLGLKYLEKLERLACKKIEIWAADGRLAKHRYLVYILFRWNNWGQQSRVKNFVRSMIKSDTGLIDFITGFLGKTTSQSISDYVKQVHWRIHLKSVEEFVDLKKVESRLRKIISSSEFEHLDDPKKLAIKTFLDTIDGKIEDRF